MIHVLMFLVLHTRAKQSWTVLQQQSMVLLNYFIVFSSKAFWNQLYFSGLAYILLHSVK